MDKAVESGRCGSAAAPSPSGSSPVPGLAASHSVTNAQRDLSAHTPGPWAITPYGDGDSLVITHEMQRDYRVCFMATPSNAKAWAVIQANASLIAAAPEMLAALKGAQAALNSAYSQAGAEQAGHDRAAASYAAIVERFIEQALAAIAKAEGRHD